MAIPEPQLFGTLDIGGSHVTAAIVAATDSAARIVRRHDRSIDPTASRAELLDAFAAPARAVDLADAPLGWAVALPGPFDYSAGIGTFTGVGKFASVAGVDLRAAFAERLGLQPDRVRFVNDAAAYGIGEWAFGHTGRPARMVCVTLGTGVGSAFLDEGRYVSLGDEVPYQGAVHTLEYAGLPLEQTVSSPALRARFLEASGRDATVEQICDEARAGDGVAAQVIDDGMSALGEVIAPWLDRFGATHFVVGGAISRSWDVIQGALTTAIADYRADADLPLLVTRARLGDEAPLLGAAEWSRIG